MKKVTIEITLTEGFGFKACVKTGTECRYTTKVFAGAPNAEHDARCWITDYLGDPKISVIRK